MDRIQSKTLIMKFMMWLTSTPRGSEIVDEYLTMIPGLGEQPVNAVGYFNDKISADLYDALEARRFDVAANIGRSAGLSDNFLVSFCTSASIRGIFPEEFKSYLAEFDFAATKQKELDHPYDTYKHPKAQ